MNEQSKPIKKFSFVTPEDKNTVSVIKSIQDDNGSVYIIYGSAVKRAINNRLFEYTILQVSKEGKVTSQSLSSLPDENIQDMSCLLTGTKLEFNALASNDKKTDFTIFLTGTFDISTKKVSVKEIELNTLSSIGQLYDTYLKNISKKGLPRNLNYDTTIYYKDGSYALLYQETNNSLYQSYYAVTPQNGMQLNTPSYSVNYLNRGNIYIIKVSASGMPEWFKTIPKDQEEPDMNLYVGFVCTTDEKDNLHLFFYDAVRNTDAEAGKHSPEKVNTSGNRRSKLACVRVWQPSNLLMQAIRKSLIYLLNTQQVLNQMSWHLSLSEKKESRLKPASF